MHSNSTRRHNRWRPTVALVISAAAFAVAGLGVGADASAASGPTLLAWGSVYRLKQSTGNLYWTRYSLNEFGPDSAYVYRASKSNTPGNERPLYSETRSDYFGIGDITYAYVGTWYGYFVVNYINLGISQIKRVPLAGGTTVTLAQSPSVVELRDLETDGSFLYWADAGGLRKMSIGGGAITTLVAGSNIVSVGLDSTRVFYSAGTAVRSVPKTGGTSTTRVIGSTNVTSMYIHGASTNTVIYWGEQDGAVKSYPLGGGTTIHQWPIPGRSTRSVSFDGTRVLWTDCASPGGNWCYVRKRQGGTTTTVSSGGVGASNIQGDASAMFWSDAGGLKKYVH